MKPELLAPAGNLKKLKIALKFGADAVYASVGSFSLRKRSAKEFTKESFIQGVSYTHAHGKKFYATLNAFPFNAQIKGIENHIEFLNEIGVDGVIVASVGVINLVKKLAPKMLIHISTQANVTNYLDAKFYYEMGASRIVLAREITLKDALEIKKMLPGLELEIFVHGSMCFAYSGRCLISAVQSGRFSNRGSCANDCRFKYELYAKDPQNATLFRLEERENDGTYIMNSKDLNLISYIDEIVATGAIDSLKIEGRTKSEYYAACTTNAYRMAINDAFAGNFKAEIYEAEIATLKNRGFSEGYLFHHPYERADTQNLDTSLVQGSKQVEAFSEDGELFAVKGKIMPGVEYEIFSPFGTEISTAKNEIGEIYEKNGKFYMKFDKIFTQTNKQMSEIHSGNLNLIKSVAKTCEFCFLRKDEK